jgi:hypothetical protein
VLERAASLVADICRRRRIPVRWLLAYDLLAGRRGLTGHDEVSEAFKQSDHWDPGDGFPVEAFVDRVRALEQTQRRAKRPAGQNV